MAYQQIHTTYKEFKEGIFSLTGEKDQEGVLKNIASKVLDDSVRNLNLRHGSTELETEVQRYDGHRDVFLHFSSVITPERASNFYRQIVDMLKWGDYSVTFKLKRLIKSGKRKTEYTIQTGEIEEIKRGKRTLSELELMVEPQDMRGLMVTDGYAYKRKKVKLQVKDYKKFGPIRLDAEQLGFPIKVKKPDGCVSGFCINKMTLDQDKFVELLEKAFKYSGRKTSVLDLTYGGGTEGFQIKLEREEEGFVLNGFVLSSSSSCKQLARLSQRVFNYIGLSIPDDAILNYEKFIPKEKKPRKEKAPKERKPRESLLKKLGIEIDWGEVGSVAGRMGLATLKWGSVWIWGFPYLGCLGIKAGRQAYKKYRFEVEKRIREQEDNFKKAMESKGVEQNLGRKDDFCVLYVSQKCERDMVRGEEGQTKKEKKTEQQSK